MVHGEGWPYPHPSSTQHHRWPGQSGTWHNWDPRTIFGPLLLFLCRFHFFSLLGVIQLVHNFVDVSYKMSSCIDQGMDLPSAQRSDWWCLLGPHLRTYFIAYQLRDHCFCKWACAQAANSDWTWLLLLKTVLRARTRNGYRCDFGQRLISRVRLIKLLTHHHQIVLGNMPQKTFLNSGQSFMPKELGSGR